MMRNRAPQSRVGYMLPVLTLILFFSVCAAALTAVFWRAEEISREAKAYNDCVQICRNEAEIFLSGETPAAQNYYDMNLCRTERESGEYLLEAEVSAEGSLVRIRLRALALKNSAEYELELTRFGGGVN